MYEEVLNKEREEFNVSEAQIEKALCEIRNVYRIIPCKKYLPGIDYNRSSYRCAYIYYFGYYHTAMVEYLLLKFKNEKESKFNDMMMYKNFNMNICSLGGGPGFDLIGLLKARSYFVRMCMKKLKCTVIDLCNGWEISLRHVRQSFLSGVGSTYNSFQVFDFDLVEANLCKPLESNVKQVIAEADVVNMVKFVSAVPCDGKRNMEYLHRIFALMKKNAYVFYVDNINGEFYKMVAKVAEKYSLKLVWNSEHRKLEVQRPIFIQNNFKSKTMKGTSVVAAVWQKIDSPL
ncbi:uncharacterized protein LOC111627687 isoform X1 [Centruroides sculpturatus]|uniref:uncharacterized protein LOC111627687 isoform X1 n=1 Tax=Centruroides sculpturatus TaxID=218467 RepID=UPI000C6E06CA|nr:uncharacterized protein LOC111627687 isoform X1 [Centruroides sculpturatus]